MQGGGIVFGKPAVEIWDWSDAEFLQSIAWKRSASETVRTAAVAGDCEAFAREWRAFATPRMPAKKDADQRLGLTAFWSRYAFDATPRMQALVDVVESFDRESRRRNRAKSPANKKSSRQKKSPAGNRLGKELQDWLQSVKLDGRLSPSELLLLFELLSERSDELDAETFWRLWRGTLSAGVDLSCQLEEPVGSDVTEDQRLLIAGELPWQIGLYFSEIKGAGTLRRTGQRMLCRSLLDQSDTDGTPHAERLERLPLWLAPLVRSAAAARRYEIELWNDEAAERFEALVSAVVPLCRPDARIALSNGSSHDVLSLLQLAARLAGIRKNGHPRTYLRSVARGLAPSKAGSAGKVRNKSDVPANQSDWAHVACLRSDWSVAASTLAVAHHREMPQLDLSVLGKPLLDGYWNIQLTLDGERLSFQDGWSCVCWHSDRDADYLELQMTFSDGLQIDRQLLLSRRDDFLLLADAVSHAGPRQIEYCSTLPLADGVEVQSDTETRECRLKAGPVIRAFPLALPQDRVQSTAGGFGPYDGGLILRQVAAGEGLYAPLLLDWSVRRRNQDAEWRVLTVAETSEIVSPRAASGHRLRMGDHQLLVYRSLKPTEESRTVLGHHTRHETVVGRFQRTGAVEAILLVEM